MIREIKINDSKLKLVQLDTTKVVRKDVIRLEFNKRKLKFQFCLKISRGENNTIHRFIYSSLNGVYPGRNIVYKQMNEIWVIEKTEIKYSGETYTDDDIRVITCFLNTLVRCDYISAAESLALSTGDKEIVDYFYKYFGSTGKSQFCGYLQDRVYSGKKYEITPINIKIQKRYERERYSVQELLYDLVEDGASILVDPDLIEEYKTIGIKKVDSQGSVRSQKEKWCKVVDVLGNSRRANLSLSVYSSVLVNIPENPYGIPSGEHEYKKESSYCIIRDGILHMNHLGVKVSEPLAKKLRRYKVLGPELLQEGEYLLNLTKIPVVNKRDLYPIGKDQLVNCEIMYRLWSAAKKYIETIYPETDDGISDGEKFLRSLGIYGDLYKMPKDREKEVRRGESYGYYEYISNTPNLPYIPEMYKYCLEYNSIQITSNVLLNKFFNEIDIKNRCEKDLENSKKEIYSIYNEVAVKLRKLKFKIMLSKQISFPYTRGYIENPPGYRDHYLVIKFPKTGTDFRVSIGFTVRRKDVGV